jgi:ribosomal protein S18 acetylase RimI-like enzyme
MSCTIDNYRPEDKKNLESVCQATAYEPWRKGRKKEAVVLMFLDYFLDKEPALATVARNEKGEAVGYLVLSAVPISDYVKAMEESYMKPIRKKFLLGYFVMKNYFGQLAKDEGLEAQLHIDIDPAYQGQGLGSQMMEAAKKKLLAIGKHSVDVLQIEKTNRNFRFYQKCGFQVLKEKDGRADMRLTF